MKRGDVFTVSARGAAAKPRPAIVLTAGEYIRAEHPIILCPLTSDLTNAPLVRVRIEPSLGNGLRVASDAMLERLGAALPREIGVRIGTLDDPDLDRIDIGLLNILGLSRAAAVLSGIGNST